MTEQAQGSEGPTGGSPGSPTGAWVPPEPSGGPAPGVEWAGYGARLLAWIIDGIVISVAVTVVVTVGVLFLASAALSGGNDGLAVAAFTLLMLVLLVMSIAYFPFFWARGGQTPGMRPFGIRVVRDVDGGPVGTGQALIRLIGLWVAGAVFYLGFIWVFIDKRRRGWHDLISGTVVVRDPAR